MPYALVLLLLLICAVVPQAWVRLVMRRHGTRIDAMPGTGGELAAHLIERFGLDGVTVERTEPFRDHFDPSGPAVRLGPENFDGKSVTAIAVAAHEVGHAIQFHRREAIFRLRARWLPLAGALRRIGVVLLMAAPFAIALRSPALIGALIGAGLLLQLLGALAYLIVLPEEWDASFGKALPILADGYVPAPQLAGVRSVLRAAALTYFAGALADLLNVGRWWWLLRR